MTKLLLAWSHDHPARTGRYIPAPEGLKLISSCGEEPSKVGRPPRRRSLNPPPLLLLAHADNGAWMAAWITPAPYWQPGEVPTVLLEPPDWLLLT